MKILEITRLSKNFGGLLAVNDVSFNVNKDEIFSIIGPNGAGKTTIFNVISGLFPATGGEVLFKGKSIRNLRSHERCKLGIGRTFQIPRIFRELTVLDNMLIGGHSLKKSGVISNSLRFPFVKKQEKIMKEKALELLEWLSMDGSEAELAGTLPFGKERFLEIGRALMADPTLMILDEPGSGLNTFEIRQLIEKIYEIRNKGLTILLIEHNMELIMKMSNRILVLNFGNKIAEGTPEEIRVNNAVISSYLGEEYTDD